MEVCFSAALKDTEEGGSELDRGLWGSGRLLSHCPAAIVSKLPHGSKWLLESTHHVHIPVEEGAK